MVLHQRRASDAGAAAGTLPAGGTKRRSGSTVCGGTVAAGVIARWARPIAAAAGAAGAGGARTVRGSWRVAGAARRCRLFG